MSLSMNAGLSTFTGTALQQSRDINLALTRLSTGKRINNAGDSMVDLNHISNLRSQVSGLKAAIFSVGNALSLLQTADDGLAEASDLLQLMKTLALNASSELVSDTDRTAANTEINQLQLAIAQIGSNTTFNGISLLDGTFSSKTIRVGEGTADTMSVTLASIKSDSLGSYILSGSTRDAVTPAASPTANNTSASEDITITVNSVSSTIAATASESAEATATKINAVTAATGVTAKARTFALLASGNGSSENYSIKVNDTATASFSISSTNVSAAVTAINAISTTTGVSAAATADFKILLQDKDGGDITLENESAGSSLTVQAVKYDGITTQGSAVTLAATNGNDATRVMGTLRLISDSAFSVTQSGTASQAYLTSASAVRSPLTGLDLTSSNNAKNSVELIESALNQVSVERSVAGAAVARLTQTTSFLSRMKDTAKASISKIEDADVALESARLAKASMLQKANAALLAHANSDRDLILSIIRAATPALQY